MKKPQRQLAAAIAYADEKIAPAPVHGLGEQYFPGYQAPGAGDYGAELYELSSILVSKREQEEQVFHTVQTEFLEFFCKCRTDPDESSQTCVGLRPICGLGHTPSPNVASVGGSCCCGIRTRSEQVSHPPRCQHPSATTGHRRWHVPDTVFRSSLP